MKLRQALAILRTLRSVLPAYVDIEEEYVNQLHRAFSDVENEIGLDLSRFYIPAGDLKNYVTSLARPRIGSRKGREATYSTQRYCDRMRFFFALEGAINFINGYIQEPDERRGIGFTHLPDKKR